MNLGLLERSTVLANLRADKDGPCGAAVWCNREAVQG